MAVEAPHLMLPGCTAAADLSAKQFFCVKISAANAVNLAAASTDAVIGILQNKPKSGAEAQVATGGLTKAHAGAAITAGAKVMSDANGKVIPYVGSAGNCCIGIAKDGAGADGDIFSVYLKDFGGIA